MGASQTVLQPQCVQCFARAGGQVCVSKERYDGWLTEELYQGMAAQHTPRIKDVLNMAPDLKERVIVFPGEACPTTALGLAMSHSDAKVVRALLEAGVSPNLPISQEQRAMYAHKSQFAAVVGGSDAELQRSVPHTHFEAVCNVQHKVLFMLLIEKSANPNSGIVQTSYAGDQQMLEALLSASAEPNTWRWEHSPLLAAAKSKIQPHEKALALLRAGADPNFDGSPQGPECKRIDGGAQPREVYPALTVATRKRDYRMVRILLEGAADANQVLSDEGLPNVLFWATYWGELELIKLFISLSRHRLNLSKAKHTGETVFDVARTAKEFAELRKPRHIAKLPLPSRPAPFYDKILELFEEYRVQHPDTSAGGVGANLTGSTTAGGGDSTGLSTGLSPSGTSDKEDPAIEIS